MYEFWLGILGGIVGWIATMLVGHPFYELINLRRETAQTLHFFEPKGKDSRAAIAAWLEERSNAYRICAAKLFAFESSEIIIARITKTFSFRWNLIKAAECLWQLAPLGPGAAERTELRSEIAKSLNLKL
jgi:hypothetical protein